MGKALVDPAHQKCTGQRKIFTVFNTHFYDSEWDAIQCCDSKRDARYSEWDALFFSQIEWTTHL